MAKAKTTIKKITQNAWECTKIFKTGEIEKRIVKDPIDIWSIGNTGVRNPWRIPGGYKVYVDNNSHLTGALGVAILSRAEEEIDFSFDIEDIIFETKGTECKGCSNNCEIIKVMRDNKIIDSWGNRCPRGELVHK